MRLRIRIREGAARGLCGTCEYALIRTNDRGQVEVRCGSHQLGETFRGVIVERVVAECNGYSGINSMSEWDATQIGWVLEVKAKEIVGFRPPKKKSDDD